MPRDIFDIKSFKYGIISALDEEDIPPESASDSLNVDGDAGEGVLQGIPTAVEKLIDSDLDATVDDALTNVKLGEFIENNGIYYFIYWDDSDNKLKVIKDFYGTTPIREEITTYDDKTAITLGSNLTFTKENKALRIGIGNGDAIWIGFRDHKLFNITDYSSIFQNAGLDDMTANISGYTGIRSEYYTIEIHDATPDPDTFKYRKGTGSFSSPAGIALGNISIGDGITISFGAVNGHTTGDSWIIAVEGLSVEKAKCETLNGTSATQFNLASPTENAGTGYFTSGLLYSWKYSLVYDGTEESCIGENIGVSDVSSGADYYTIRINAEYGLLSPYLFRHRVTGINLYRADSSDGSVSGLGLYRKIASIDINHAQWESATPDKFFRVIDYGTYWVHPISGAITPSENVTYQENSGISETLEDVSTKFELSATGNGYHFVGRNYHSKIVDASRYIFKSKGFRYDMFDWTKDFLIMPEPYTALHFYDGKLWVASLSKIYRINPDQMYIEDVFEDAGCQGQRSIHSNEYGMFLGNKNGAWMYGNGTFYPISQAIRQSASGGKSWKTLNFIVDSSPTLSDLIVTSDSKKGYVLFVNERDSSGDKIFAWAYSPILKRWDAFSFADYASSANAGVFKGKDGEVYLSNGTGTYNLMRNTGYEAWEWYSQELSFGSTRQEKSMVMVKVDTTGTVSINLGYDGGTVNNAYTNETLINQYKKSIRIKLNAASGSNSVDSLEIIYRPKIGNR
ncbi:MAG: hypothetical protein ACP5N7_06030 [Candidatus Pacearchaeota archaeon]